jgi:hypothetical protein
MPTWWTRVLRHFGNAEAEDRSAELTLSVAAEKFLRRARSNYDPPDQRAICKAMALLEKALTPQQRSDLFARGFFYVKGRRFTYRIHEGCSANVDALDSSGSVISRLCAHPQGRTPVYDVMLAQKLWIETDEDMFLSNAAPIPR